MRTRNQDSAFPGPSANESRSSGSAIFVEWMQEYGGIPVKIARSFAANLEDQSDLRQQMHLQIWRSRESFSSQAKVSTWIYRVCLNTALTWQRAEKRRQRFFESDNVAELWRNDTAAADPRLAALYAVIRQLPPADRALLLLYLDDRKYREIAEITGLSESNVGVRLLRLKRELVERLKEEIGHD